LSESLDVQALRSRRIFLGDRRIDDGRPLVKDALEPVKDALGPQCLRQALHLDSMLEIIDAQ
jgi:hypothetical protein